MRILSFDVLRFWYHVADVALEMVFGCSAPYNRVARFRNVAPIDRASGFLLSMLSPVWRAKLCGDVGGESRLQLDLAGEEASAFKKLLALGSGAAVTMDGGVEELVALGRMADRYQVEVVQAPWRTLW